LTYQETGPLQRDPTGFASHIDLQSSSPDPCLRWKCLLVVSVGRLMDVAEIPQRTIIKDSHVDGASFFKIKFEGISKRIYGIKKMKRAML
jgi:hypothetical protein